MQAWKNVRFWTVNLITTCEAWKNVRFWLLLSVWFAFLNKIAFVNFSHMICECHMSSAWCQCTPQKTMSTILQFDDRSSTAFVNRYFVVNTAKDQSCVHFAFVVCHLLIYNETEIVSGVVLASRMQLYRIKFKALCDCHNLTMKECDSESNYIDANCINTISRGWIIQGTLWSRISTAQHGARS